MGTRHSQADSPLRPASARAAAGSTDDAPDVRNVVVVGHTGSGKTTLVEALLLATGVVHRAGRVEDGTTVSDYDEAEIRQQRSVGLSVAPLVHGDVTVNLLDTPGYADFVGDLRAGLRAADCALFAVSTAEPIDESTRMLWAECDAVGMPRAVVLTKLDHPRSDFEATLQQCRTAFGEKVLALCLPVFDGPGPPTALTGVLDADEAALLDPARSALIEGIIEESEDETLMERYLSGDDLDPAVLIADMRKAVARAAFHPAIPVCSTTGLGTLELLDVMTSAFPSPAEHPLPVVTTLDGQERTDLSGDPAGPLLAEVVKTTSDPYVGRVSLVRIFSGTLRPEAVVHVSGHFLADRGHEDHDEDERVGALSVPVGRTLRPVPEGRAGDIVAVAKLSRAETGDTLSDPGDPLLMRPWTMPEPLLPVAIAPRAKADEDKLAQGLARLIAEDVTLRVENNAETHQLVLWTMGEAHADVVLDRLASRYRVRVDQLDLRVPLRETVAAEARGRGRHVKQTGGHGQYAVCELIVQPLAEGAGVEFVDRVVGGAVPRQFIPSVEKGVRGQLRRGTTPGGYPMVDVRITLVDGKAHTVDSSDLAFQTAGALAVRDAAAGCGVNLLEPVDEISVSVPDDYVGTIMGDLAGRRGRVLGSESVLAGHTVVRAEVPQTELVRYAVELRSLSHGAGTFTRTFVRYEPMPASLAAKLT